jgi:hypothetical protein
VTVSLAYSGEALLDESFPRCDRVGLFHRQAHLGGVCDPARSRITGAEHSGERESEGAVINALRCGQVILTAALPFNMAELGLQCT